MGKTASSSSKRGENEDEMDKKNNSSSKSPQIEDEGSLILPGFRGAAHRQKPKTAGRKKRPAAFQVRGGGGIRTPGTFQYNSFQDCRHRPLGHAS